MKLQIEREIFLKPLQLVTGVVERRQTLPILANVLLSLKKQNFTMVGTDLEVELCGHIALETAGESGAITVPARKLMDVCRSLSEHAQLEIYTKETKLIVRAGRLFKKVHRI